MICSALTSVNTLSIFGNSPHFEPCPAELQVRKNFSQKSFAAQMHSSESYKQISIYQQISFTLLWILLFHIKPTGSMDIIYQHSNSHYSKMVALNSLKLTNPHEITKSINGNKVWRNGVLIFKFNINFISFSVLPYKLIQLEDSICISLKIRVPFQNYPAKHSKLYTLSDI